MKQADKVGIGPSLDPVRGTCPTHGDVTEVIENTMGEKPLYVCLRCYWDWLVGTFGLLPSKEKHG